MKILSDNEINKLRTAEKLCVDIETKDPLLESQGPGTHRGDSYICGVGVGAKVDGETIAAYLPLRHPDTTDEVRNRNEHVISDLLLSGTEKIGANIVYDYEHLLHDGYDINMDVTHDIQYAEPLLDEYARRYSLDALAKRHSCGAKRADILKDYCTMMGWTGKPINNLWRMPQEVVEEYVIGDVTLPLDIFAKQYELLEKESLLEVYKMETELIPLLLRMRKNGVCLDVPLLERTIMQVSEKHYALKLKLRDWAGSDINLNSSTQLAEVFDRFDIRYPRREPTPLMMEKGLKGNPKLDKASLSKMANTEPICETIMEYRHYDTLINMFLSPYLDMQVGGKLYGSFHPLRSDDYGTVSGRFSSSKPNLQQVSAIDEDTEDGADQMALKGQILRALFKPVEGRLWGKLDYSQVEYRIMMHYAEGPVAERLREAYNNDPTTDMHKVIQDSTGFNRRTSKRLNFGGAYGMGIPTAAELFGWTIEEATVFMGKYHTAAPYVKTLRRSVAKKAARVGYIYTLLGRRARTHPSRKLHSMFNRLIQGSAADVMKRAMVDVEASGVLDELVLHLTVHDELDVSYEDTKIGNEALMETKNIMTNAVKLSVPLLVDCHTGHNWAEAD